MYHIRNTVAVLERIAFAAGNCIEIDEYKNVMKSTSDAVLYAVDLAGTFVFAVEGASAAAHGNLDVLGMMVLAFSTAVGGGIFRDLLIGAVPPQPLRDWRYGVTAFAGAAVVFFLDDFVRQLPPNVVVVLDAGGLALFAVSGAGKALAYKIHPFIAILMGTITGVGGGTVRDVLLAQVPVVLRSDVYATAAMAGSAVMVLGLRLRMSSSAMAAAGGLVCFTLRLVAVWRYWNLPKLMAP
jgi:uncharacterized membrane protein YeiH